MVMGYFDESSSFNNLDYMCMVGYLADENNWNALTLQWSELLKKYELPFMHLADFMAGEGIYEELGWKGEPKKSKRKEVIDSFIAAIQQHTISGIGAGINAKAFRQIFKEEKKKPAPHVFLFERVLKLVRDRLEKWEWKEPVVMVFDDNEQYAMRCYSAFCDVRRFNPNLKKIMAAIGFGNDEVFAPLQAADFLACATSREMRYGRRAWSKKYSRFRPLLLSEDPAFGKLYDSEDWKAKVIRERKDEILSLWRRKISRTN